MFKAGVSISNACFSVLRALAMRKRPAALDLSMRKRPYGVEVSEVLNAVEALDRVAGARLRQLREANGVIGGGEVQRVVADEFGRDVSTVVADQWIQIHVYRPSARQRVSIGGSFDLEKQFGKTIRRDPSLSCLGARGLRTALASLEPPVDVPTGVARAWIRGFSVAVPPPAQQVSVDTAAAFFTEHPGAAARLREIGPAPSRAQMVLRHMGVSMPYDQACDVGCLLLSAGQRRVKIKVTADEDHLLRFHYLSELPRVSLNAAIARMCNRVYSKSAFYNYFKREGRRTRVSCQDLFDGHAALEPLKELLAQPRVGGVAGVCEALLAQGDYAVSYTALRQYLAQER